MQNAKTTHLVFPPSPTHRPAPHGAIISSRRRRAVVVRAKKGSNDWDCAEQLVLARRAAAESDEQLGVAQQALRESTERLKQLNGAEESARRGEEERGRLAEELRVASDRLAAAERDLEVAQRQAREAEELFAAAADERAAKVKELVQEIDHWHDAATLAQEMEAEARAELDSARALMDDVHDEAGL